MCPPIQRKERDLLPDCSITNRVIMFSLLHSLNAEERSVAELSAELRDRYELFQRVLSNFPPPQADSGFYFDLDDHLGMLSGVHSTTSMLNNPASSDGRSLSSNLSAGSNRSLNLSISSNAGSETVVQLASEHGDYFVQAERYALAELRRGGAIEEKDETVQLEQQLIVGAGEGDSN